ncbi:hypothetical protein [Moorena sp. SIO3I6]|nr:hypothetical protein [Moorena sp. SIO3I6]
MVGGITIGDNAVIGAGYVVVKDVYESSVFVGKSGKFIRKVGDQKVNS